MKHFNISLGKYILSVTVLSFPVCAQTPPSAHKLLPEVVVEEDYAVVSEETSPAIAEKVAHHQKHAAKMPLKTQNDTPQKLATESKEKAVSAVSKKGGDTVAEIQEIVAEETTAP